MRRFLLGVAAVPFATRIGCATGPSTRPMPDDPWGDDPHASVSLSSVFSSGTASMAEGVALLDGLCSGVIPGWGSIFSSLLLAEQVRGDCSDDSAFGGRRVKGVACGARHFAKLRSGLPAIRGRCRERPEAERKAR
jgi:hypothetical protein